MIKQLFVLKEDAQGHLISLSHPEDDYNMNWVDGATPWGTVRVPEWPKAYEGWGAPGKPYRLDVRIERNILKNGRLRETFVFENNSESDIYTLARDISIYAPFNDSYESARECKTNRCSAHIWCGNEASYVMALRMGGRAPHLGLALTKGGLAGYSIERDPSKGSNDRGDIVFHPSPMCIPANDARTVEWELFWFSDEVDFRAQLRSFPCWIDVQSDHYIYFTNECIDIQSNAEPSRVAISSPKPGVYHFDFKKNRRKSFAEAMVLPEFDALLQSRVRFIAENQQCMRIDSPLYGAYLIYDNEEKRQYYSHAYDHNAGRERVGMGVLLARYLRTHQDPAIQASLNLYLEFVLRELFDGETGRVFNDCGRNMEWNRLYNYPWVSQLFHEVWKLKGDVEYLLRAAKVLECFFKMADGCFYAIGLNVVAVCEGLRECGKQEMAEMLGRLFYDYAEKVYACGTDYPAHEVKYEQSIVQPAAEAMMQAYTMFHEKRFLESAREHINLLKLFNGHQPDYHMYETALRHWDAYWFGKRKLLGDTYPHYWSGLTGQAFMHYARITGDETYAERGENALRSPLSLFKADGSASCAFVYPMDVNGRTARFEDPWANDQDWGMYYYLKWHDGLGG